MVKPLQFKGDKKPLKKRKRTDPSDEPSTSSSISASTAEKFGSSAAASSSSTALTTTDNREKEKKVKVVNEDLDADDGWVNSDSLEDIRGPVIFAFVSLPFYFFFAMR